MEEITSKDWQQLPVVLHECVEVVGVGVLVYVLAGPVDVGGHVSTATERLVIHVVGLVFTTSEAAVHTLRRNVSAAQMGSETVPWVTLPCPWSSSIGTRIGMM